MAELEPQTAQSPAPADADPTAGLYKMSTTAGVGTADYVAVNTMSVVAAVVGLATLLALAHWLFMFIGLAAIVCGLIALHQIRDSNGTQGGAMTAWAGIVMAVLFAGIALAMEYRSRAALVPERQGVNALIDRVGKLIISAEAARAKGETDAASAPDDARKAAVRAMAQEASRAEYRKAYDLFTAEFQSRVPFEQFEQRLRQVQGFAGPIQDFRGNDVFRFSPPERPRMAETIVVIRFETLKDSRHDAAFQKVGEEWRVLRLDLVDPQQQRR
jgi:hypothetical protein